MSQLPRSSQLSLGLSLAVSVLLAGCSDSSGPSIEGRAIYAVTADNHLILFGSEAPGTIVRDKVITGVTATERIVAIDFRPADEQLYGLGSDDRIYALNTSSGAATVIGTTAFTPALDGDHFGFDFNPVVDRARTASAETAQNLRLNPATGALAGEDTDFYFAVADVNDGTAPAVGGVAYTNSETGATVTTLYAIDATSGSLAVVTNPNGGLMTTVGPLGVTTTESIGFDIDASDGTAYATLTGGVASSLYTVNLTSGTATLIGAVGSGMQVEGLAVAP